MQIARTQMNFALIWYLVLCNCALRVHERQMTYAVVRTQTQFGSVDCDSIVADAIDNLPILEIVQ